MTADERVAVRTYVPEYQKEIWREHADRLDMSQSEFVRTMVQAGRADFEVTGLSDTDSERGKGSDDTESAERVPVTNGGVNPAERFEERVLEALGREEPLDWDQLVAEVTDDVEGSLDEAVERLELDNRIRYSGREGGYVLTDDGNRP